MADCRLIGAPRRCPARPSRRRVHFTGRVRLAREAPAAPPAAAPPADRRRPASGHDDVYRVYFHGPAYQVLERAWRDNGDVVGRLARRAARRPRAAEHADCEIAPRLIELCFQTAGRVGARHGRPDGAADRTSTASLRFAGADAPGPRCGPS